MNSIITIIVCIVASYLLPGFTMYMLFKKGEVKRYLAWIPIINFIYLLKIVDFKWYYIFEYIITLGVCALIFFMKFNILGTNIIFVLSAFLFMLYYIRLNVRIAKKFNKGIIWVIILNLIPEISHIILAIKGKYSKTIEFNNSKVKFGYLFLSVLAVVVSFA